MDAKFDEKYECKTLIFYVNGERIEVDKLDPMTPLAVFLRENLHLTGTKIGCNEGGCGACVVAVSEHDASSGTIWTYSVNSCLAPICSLFGKAITTIEGIQNNGTMHSIQERLFKKHGSQCGFCTPGFIMAMYALLRNNSNPSHDEIDEAIQGNLCRCTGYRPILEAFYTFAGNDRSGTATSECLMGENCCKNKKMNSHNAGIQGNGKRANSINSSNGDKASCEDLVFPPALQIECVQKQSFHYEYLNYLWLQPKSMPQAITAFKRFPNAKIVAGSTEVSIERKFQNADINVVIYLKELPELRKHTMNAVKGIYIGASITLNEMKRILRNLSRDLPDWKCGVLNAVSEMLSWFAGQHVRNVATFAGNIMTASPISDLNPLWLAADAQLSLMNKISGCERIEAMNERFFTLYRRNTVKQCEIVQGIWIPYTGNDQFFRAYKQSQRREDDIAIVNGAFMLDIDRKYQRINWIRIAYGGVASITKMAVNTQEALLGRVWNEEVLYFALERLQEEFELSPGAPGGMEKYRQALVLSFFYKFFMDSSEYFQFPFHEQHSPAVQNVVKGMVALQIYQEVPPGQPRSDPVGRPIPHISGSKQVRGNAIYCDDQRVHNALSISMVMSPVACGRLNSIDLSEAEKVPGYRGYVGFNDLSLLQMQEEVNGAIVFIKDKISFHGEAIGAIVADNHEIAWKCARLTKVTCTESEAVVSIEDAIKKKSFLLEKPFVIHSKPSRDSANSVGVSAHDWSENNHIIKGTVRTGAQEHFYLETNCCIVIPGEDDELEIISSSQNICQIQNEISRFVGVHSNKVTVRVKRIGGGFGGKESVSVMYVAMAVVAARKFKRAIRHTLERYDDMLVSGNRHPFRCDYTIGMNTSTGSLQMEMRLYSNCGYTMDLSTGVMTRAILHADNVYKFKEADIYGVMCRTNLASNTAFRGFGAPQAMFACECMMLHAAEEFGIDVDEFRQQHFYENGDATPQGMRLNHCDVRRCWSECIELSCYRERCQSVAQFNGSYKFKKRGIYLTPTRFGVGFGLKYLNQGGALVHIYLDGTVLISHGGMEMGQGLHTKLIQIASRCLKIDYSLIFISETSSDKVPNASPTAASVGSDLYGLAIQNACDILNDRLQPIKDQLPNGAWKEWILAAYMQRIALSTTGFAKTTTDSVDFEKGTGGTCFPYCVYGVSCAEVEIDCLTGDHRVIRVDIVMGLGNSLNPAIDIGQIEGAFVQGYGLFTMEDVKVRPNGIRLTRGPSNYKIPCADDAPRQFNVKLLANSPDECAIFSSKAVGEPPLFMGCSVFFAIRQAIKAYREENGFYGYFHMDAPATSETIRLECCDSIIGKLEKVSDKSQNQKWTIAL